jgi:ribosomal protein S18 acetylase RimI-like enzyme
MGNEPARRLYARLGFVEYGIERNSLKHKGRYYDEILMAKDLTDVADAVVEVKGSLTGVELAAPSAE